METCAMNVTSSPERGEGRRGPERGEGRRGPERSEGAAQDSAQGVPPSDDVRIYLFGMKASLRRNVVLAFVFVLWISLLVALSVDAEWLGPMLWCTYAVIVAAWLLLGVLPSRVKHAAKGTAYLSLQTPTFVADALIALLLALVLLPAMLGDTPAAGWFLVAVVVLVALRIVFVSKPLEVDAYTQPALTPMNLDGAEEEGGGRDEDGHSTSSGRDDDEETKV